MKWRGVQLLFGVGLPTASFGPPRSPDRRPTLPKTGDLVARSVEVRGLETDAQRRRFSFSPRVRRGLRQWLGLSLILLAGPLAAQDWLPDYLNPECAVGERVTDLLQRLTLEEKVGQMENVTQPIRRLGVIGYDWWSESIHGVGRAGRATVFPAAIGLAATWDVPLMTRVGAVISTEARAKHQEAPTARYHGLTYWAPAVYLARDPRWGRIEETYGEDPCLVTQMGLAMVKALQGDDPQHLKIAATLKHFAVHSQETDRHCKLFDVSERALHEYYLAPFRACFIEGQAASVMSAYNGFNGVPSTANRWLLTDLLRGEWGFDGAVVTDWGAPRNLRTQFKWAPTDEDAVVLALRAGVDVLCQYDSCESAGLYDNILTGVRLGNVTESQLDTALRRSLKVRFRLGLFDPPESGPYDQISPAWLGLPEHVALARQASREAIVLLKNDRWPGRNNPAPILPLDRQRLESIAVIGSHANRLFLGAYSGDPAAPARTTYQGITNHVSDTLIVRSVPWTEIDDPKKKDAPLDEQKRNLAAAVKAASISDVAVVVLGLNSRIESEGRDRTNLDLPKDQQDFVEKVVAVNPATIVVLINGGPLAVNWLHRHVPAVLEAWYPGEQGGNAIADVLFGDYNPAGRLPITFYASVLQLPPLDDYEISAGRTYLYLPDAPLYPFGHGLSYTHFDYQNLRVDRQADGITASAEVTNTGNRDGDEVVQLYVHTEVPGLLMPAQQLRAFQRVSIPCGATQTVRLSVRTADLAYWDENRPGFVVAPGDYEFRVGASSADIRLRTTIRVEP